MHCIIVQGNYVILMILNMSLNWQCHNMTIEWNALVEIYGIWWNHLKLEWSVLVQIYAVDTLNIVWTDIDIPLKSVIGKLEKMELKCTFLNTQRTHWVGKWFSLMANVIWYLQPSKRDNNCIFFWLYIVCKDPNHCTSESRWLLPTEPMNEMLMELLWIRVWISAVFYFIQLYVFNCNSSQRGSQ